VIGATLARMDAQLQTHPVAVNLPSDLPLVPLDSVLIEQVLINLLENAVKYTPAQSPIEINAHQSGDTVVVNVADHGPGLADEEKQRVFDKFYCIRPNHVRNGSGLGLTICRGIIEAHGGQIWIENRNDGTGAVFIFTLPLDGEPPIVDAEMLDA